MRLCDIPDLIRILSSNRAVSSFSFICPNSSVKKISWQRTPQKSPKSPIIFKAENVGVFIPSKRNNDFVKKGEVVGHEIVLKIITPIKSPATGFLYFFWPYRIIFEYGQPLFKIIPA